MPPILTSSGLILYTLAALSGWILDRWYRDPDYFKKFGVVQPRRFLQVHLDWIMMGSIAIALDFALPQRPLWITLSLAFGIWVNPLLFIPQAWGDDKAKGLFYDTLSTCSYIASSVGFLSALVVYFMNYYFVK